MFKLFSNTFKATPAVLGVMLLVNGLAIQQANANETVSPQNPDVMLDSISEYSESTPMNQVTSVSQLRDVSPTDWAYEALRSLVERYGCIVGYPDRTYRGNRALSRYEFAAGLNACMQQMERLIAASEAVLREDIEKLQRLMKEFETELAALGARVDNLEGRVAFLEDHQFSTTTKLKGEAIISVQAYGGPDQKLDQFYNLPTTSPIPDDIKADLGLGSKELTATTVSGGDITGATRPDDVDDQTTMSNRVRLVLDSSFTGKDKLRTRLSAANVPDLGSAFGTGQARLNFDQNNGNDVEVDRLWYSAPLGDKFKFWIGTALPAEDIYETFSPYTESSGTGSLARANRFNPFIYRAGGDAGLAFKYTFNKTFDFTASYLAGDAENPARGNGLFNGQYSAGAQIGVHPGENFDLGIAYMFAYYPGSVNGMTSRANLTGSLGSDYTSGVSNSIAYLGGDGGFRGARDPFSGAATSVHNVGLQGNWRLSEKVNWGAWMGWASATGESHDSTGANRKGDWTELWTWNTNFSFLDLGKEGAVLTIAGGQLPRAGYVDGTFGRDLDQSWIVEGNYNYPINSNISLTPGVYAIFNPNNSADNDTIVVGVLRSVFKF